MDPTSEGAAEPRYLSRALTWLGFNGRVLEEAQDPTLPVLERARFLGIFSSNLDEFFMIRVAGLREAVLAGVGRAAVEEESTEAVLSQVGQRCHGLTRVAYAAYEREILPAFRESGVHFLGDEEVLPKERAFLDRLFAREILPILTPAAVEPDLPFPHVTNFALCFAVRLAREGLDERFALVQLPRQYPRWIQVGSRGGSRFVLLEDVVRRHLAELFPGHEIKDASLFRVTRDADFATDDQEAEDLVDAVRNVLRQRRSGDPIRLEIEAPASDEIMERLVAAFQLESSSVYRVSGPLDLKFLIEFTRVPSLPAPRAVSWPPQAVPNLPPGDAIWEAIAERDFLLFHPYESFEPVLRLLRFASEDPAVLAIKQVLYRTASNSEVVRALERAAENGKQVAALVELQARFDEERNANWARRLEDAGAQVLYGLAGLKTHAKALLIVRRGPGGIERYAHVGTGNYNERTVLDYSDLSLLTSNEDLCADLTAFFNVVTGYSEPLPWRMISMAPLGLRSRFLSLIRREMEKSTTEEPGQIRAKMNALVDKPIIDALYEASRAGVKIQLNVRGSCVLRPGVKDLSENIRVVSIMDHFLEHSRIFEFRNGGDTETYVGSADWMPRNLDRRVELVFPVIDPELRARLGHILDVLFADNVKARELRADGALTKRASRRRPARAQEIFWEEARARAEGRGEGEKSAFVPLRSAPP
jgi:polyphosphate kinase